MHRRLLTLLASAALVGTLFVAAPQQAAARTFDTTPSIFVAMDGVTYTLGSYQYPGVTSRSLYDWTKYNTLQNNFGRTRADLLNAQLADHYARTGQLPDSIMRSIVGEFWKQGNP